MFRSDRRARGALVALLILLALAVGACSQKMRDQPKLNPDEPTTLFASGTSSQPIVADTVPRGYADTDTVFYTGMDAKGQPVTEFPFPITRQDLLRGQEEFNIYCAPCHGRVGNGAGVVVARGFKTPPTYHQDRLRNAPVGHFYDVITNGFGAMPSYGNQIAPRDRWDIVAYIRALQFSQYANVKDLPPEDRQKLQQLQSGG
ncbi:MAG TPA: cytochrome c [Chloroflexota bacterium]|jgi:mono/diheme cytochrome c family protein|nr:cytochrome c [Chloroflexota bacterium]